MKNPSSGNFWENELFNYWLFVFISGALLIWPAIWNNYPLLFFGDSAAYLHVMDTLYPISHRAFFYSIFIKIASLNGNWLWGIVYSQGVLVMLSLSLVRRALGFNFKIDYLLLSFLLLSGAPWVISKIMPDIFTAVMILNFCALLLTMNLRRVAFGSSAFLLILSINCHTSNFVVGLGLITGLCFLRLTLASLMSIIKYKQLGILFVLLISSKLIGGFVDDTFNNKYAEDIKYVFATARLAELGILQDYLEDNCPDEDIFICPLKHKVTSHYESNLFGGSFSLASLTNAWSYNSIEYGDLYWNVILESPERFLRYCSLVIGDTMRLLSMTDIVVDNIPVQDAKTFHWKRPQFLKSNQLYRNYLPVNFANIISIMTCWVGALGCMAFLLFTRKSGSDNIALCRLVIVTIFLGILSNAFFVAASSTIVERYNNRVVWLVGLAVVFVFGIYRREIING